MERKHPAAVRMTSHGWTGGECHPAPWAGLRADRWERGAAAGAVRRQPCSAVGADLPVQGDFALALVALVDELVKRLLELQE